jgi:hypothetical protein
MVSVAPRLQVSCSDDTPGPRSPQCGRILAFSDQGEERTGCGERGEGPWKAAGVSPRPFHVRLVPLKPTPPGMRMSPPRWWGVRGIGLADPDPGPAGPRWHRPGHSACPAADRVGCGRGASTRPRRPEPAVDLKLVDASRGPDDLDGEMWALRVRGAEDIAFVRLGAPGCGPPTGWSRSRGARRGCRAPGIRSRSGARSGT